MQCASFVSNNKVYIMATTSVRIDQNLVNKAVETGRVYTRTAPKQIEHWAKIGLILEDNPELNFNFVFGCKKAKLEIETGDVTKYDFK